MLGVGFREIPNTSHPSPITFSQMNSALDFTLPCPPTTSFMVSIADFFGTRPTADTRVTFIVQEVVWQFVFEDVIPDVFSRPRGKRIDLDKIMFRVPFNVLDVRP